MAKKQAEEIKVGIYLRVSSQQQAAEGYSLANQERRLKSYCEIMNWTVEGIYRDEGISGKRSDRPGLQALLEKAKSGAVSKVLALKLDRVSRNTKDLLNITGELEDLGVALVCLEDSIDTSSATGKLLRTVLSAIGQFESDIACERTLSAKAELSRQGKFAGGAVAFGYNYDKTNKEFTIVEDEAAIVELIFKELLDDRSAGKIAKQLNERGVKTKKGGEWQAKQILGIARNGFYTGRLSWQGIVNTGTHEAIVSERQFNRVQRILDANK